MREREGEREIGKDCMNSAPLHVDSSQEPKWTSLACFPNGSSTTEKTQYLQTLSLLP